MPTAQKPPRKTRRKAEPSEVPERLARRERRRERSREEIAEAARRVLLRDGLRATTLDAVAREVGVTKAALYYYYPSKDALLFDLIFGTVEAQSRAIHDAVADAKNGRDALRAVVREMVRVFASRMDDFRLVFMHAQVAGPGAVHLGAEQFARLRPLNDLAFGGAAKLLTAESKHGRGRARVEPRLLVFLAYLASVGLLTMKGMVESVGDPLAYSDEELIEGFARVFAAAAEP